MNYGQFIEACPPEKAPIDEVAEKEYGLAKGLRQPHRVDHLCRCANCQRMQLPNNLMVWVPDCLHIDDSEEVVEEAARVNSFNGHFSSWCLKCAQQLGKPSEEHLYNVEEISKALDEETKIEIKVWEVVATAAIMMILAYVIIFIARGAS